MTREQMEESYYTHELRDILSIFPEGILDPDLRILVQNLQKAEQALVDELVKDENPLPF
jgi:hypothetical protein